MNTWDTVSFAWLAAGYLLYGVIGSLVLSQRVLSGTTRLDKPVTPVVRCSNRGGLGTARLASSKDGMAQSMRELVDRLQVKHGGKTTRLEIDIKTGESFESVALAVHEHITIGDVLTLINGEQVNPNHVHLMAIVNIDEDAAEFSERVGRWMMLKYKTVVLTEYFQLDPKEAIALWNRTIETAEMQWSINSKGGEG